MGKPEGFEQTPEVPYVAVLEVTPALASTDGARLNFHAHLRANPKALLLIAYASGGTPESLNPFIQEYTDRGIPVFLLSNNPADDHGIREITYGVQADAAKAGAVSFKDVNINNFHQVVRTIQDAAKEGLEGEDLKKAIIAQFGMATEGSHE
ncbi:MAG: hypothetical protein AAB480_02980 [Patescibacteria group bacterium]